MNFGLAWISVLLAVILAAAYFTRKAIIEIPKKRDKFIKLNKALRKYHIYIGAALVITGVLHGIFSTEKLFSINWGTFLWVVSILLGISWMLKKRLSGKKNWMHYHRLLVVLYMFSIVIHVVDVDGIQIFNVLKASKNIRVTENIDMTDAPVENTIDPTVAPTDTPVSTSTSSPDPTPVPTPVIDMPLENVYNDGTYSGQATGFQPGLVVSVTIKDNKIISVEVVDHNEINSAFWSAPVNYIPGWIVESQSTEVDTVTGATFTSTGIINAVNDALRQALVSGTIPDDLSLPTGKGRH